MKWFTGRRIVIRPRGEDGNVLITVVLVSMLIGALSSLLMATARQADQSSASDKHKEIALAVAESGIHEVISELSAQTETGVFPNSWDPPQQTTPNGPYDANVSRCVSDAAANPVPCQQMTVTDGYVIESWGKAGIQQFARERRIRASVEPAELFPGEEGPYALFSYKNIELKGNDVIAGGDVWANDSITFDQNNKIYGNVTSATSWIEGAKSGSEVFGDLWSGGYHCTPEVPDNPMTAGPCVPGDLWAMDLTGNGDPVKVHGSARASVSTPCAGAPQSPHYDIKGGTIAENATTNGVVTGVVSGTKLQNTCTPAAAKKEIDDFSYVPSSYTPAPQEFTSAAAFNAYSGPRKGTFHIVEPNPSQTNRVNLDGGWNVSGDLTVITNTPIYGGNNFSDAAAHAAGLKPKIVLVSTYNAPDAGQCLLQGNGADESECAIHFKNNLRTDCTSAVLLHAKYGPVGIKNNNDMCGSIMSEGILIKNNQKLNYDSRFDRVTGLGDPGYEIARWQECPVDGCD